MWWEAPSLKWYCMVLGKEIQDSIMQDYGWLGGEFAIAGGPVRLFCTLQASKVTGLSGAV